MSLFLGDIRILTALQVGLEDLSKNPWLLNDILGDTITNPYLRERYGSQIESCRQWLENNRINIVLDQRDDKLEFPAVTIQMGTSNEKPEMKTMADFSTESVELLANDINKPIPYVIKPTNGSYDQTSGIFTFSSDVDTTSIASGMILVDPSTATGYIIQGIAATNQINLLVGLNISVGNYGVIPQYQRYKSLIGHTFMQEPYKIVCSANDQQTLLWLHSITVYNLLRYRQVLLEKDGYAESLISSSQMYPNPDYSSAGQVIWSRDINLTGQVENRWVVQPHRYIETAQIGTGGGNTGTDNAYIGGLRILSNITDTFEDLNTVNWSTLADAAYEGES